MGLVPVKLLDINTLHSLDTSYWTPTYHTTNIFLSALKVYSGLLGTYHEDLSSCTFCDSQGRNLTANTTIKNNLDYIHIHAVKNYQSQPNFPHRILPPNINIMRKISILDSPISALEKLTVRASNRWPNLGHTMVFPSLPPHYHTLYVTVLLPMYPTFPSAQIFPQNTLSRELASILTSVFQKDLLSKINLRSHHC